MGVPFFHRVKIMAKMYLYQIITFIFLSLLLPIFSPAHIVFAQNTKLAETEQVKRLSHELNTLKEKFKAIEKNQLTNNVDQTEHIKQTLSISSDTVKYVGTITSIILPLIIFLIGYQVIRSYQFEREIRETRNLMTGEYQKMLDIRNNSEKLISETKTKMGSLEEFIGNLATDFLHKRTSKLISEVKEQTNQVIGEIRTKDEDMKKSVELMKKLETLDLTLTPSVYVERGIIYLEQGNMEKSIENFNKAIELKNNSFEAYFQRGRAYHRMEKFDEAINDYMKAIEIDPKEPASYANIGVCYRAKQDYEKSIQNLTKALELNPQYEFAHIHRSITYAQKEKYDLAINDLKEVEKLNPNSSPTLLKIGFYYGKMGNFDSAIGYYLKAIEKEKTVGAMLNLSEAYTCKKDFINAEKWANESYKLSIDIRNKLLSKFLLITTLILAGKEYELELKSFIEVLTETPNFEIGDWSFEELLRCLTDSSILSAKTELVRKMITLLKKEMKPKDFSLC
ncbi:MAG: hypothetical protein A2X87_03240 [Deltaproteobacteria bacterium GWC2_42_51]|nr:MAG: hypothetical protein A2X87_03240 [Deltaproteobacteria bacterium GWC2_42_51]OGP43142.1 MAG: hypothetical protein A2090_11840 [Deltaproteobacteria bacterium GWD2_42_10]OGP45969.1 MAG: hypothetical protein A2022_00890 [Deltaproteobacteria bacterium GWF2_42_12]OGQ26360.1 MAG: hypothetical protein A3D29_08660 [Deltaproteobacteria bacterium RIFCSPHIGHO2_02_FULL_42_44]OGQ67424.1 MAG: hypothetical protein A3F88_00740 [Deltaproteobacteria bacterium RIFCSPLOWO2_12_FULL_42_16]